jgi:hypothetical protein
MKWRSICSVTSKSAMTPSRSGRRDVRGCASDHPPRFGTNRVDLTGSFVDRYNRGLEEDDPCSALVHDRVGGGSTANCAATTSRASSPPGGCKNWPACKLMSPVLEVNVVWPAMAIRLIASAIGAYI